MIGGSKRSIIRLYVVDFDSIPFLATLCKINTPINIAKKSMTVTRNFLENRCSRWKK